MSGPSGPAVVAVRTAVRDALLRGGTLADGPHLVACSGGPDSVALAAATAWVAPRIALRAGAVVIDHGLQEGSERVAATAAATCRALGLDPVEVVRVAVPQGPGRGGPEARARVARTGAYVDVARRWGAAAVLLGHTRDDQAETVLLGLARGSGARSLAGMAPDARLPGTDVRLLRPLLGLERATVRAAAVESGLPLWHDPHNADPAFARVRVRGSVLPALTAALGPGAVPALARTADLLRADADALDCWAEGAYAAAQVPDEAAPGRIALDVGALADLPVAVRTRVIVRGLLEVGTPAARLTSRHVGRVEALVTSWRGQGSIGLPGGVTAGRRCGRLVLSGARPPRSAS